MKDLDDLIDSYDLYNFLVCHRFNRVIVNIAYGMFKRCYKRANEKTRSAFQVLLKDFGVKDDDITALLNFNVIPLCIFRG